MLLIKGVMVHDVPAAPVALPHSSLRLLFVLMAASSKGPFAQGTPLVAKQYSSLVAAPLGVPHVRRI